MNEVTISGQLFGLMSIVIEKTGIPAVRARLVVTDHYPRKDDETVKLFTKEVTAVEQFSQFRNRDWILVTGNIGVHRGVYVYVTSVQPYERDEQQVSATHHMEIPREVAQ